MNEEALHLLRPENAPARIPSIIHGNVGKMGGYLEAKLPSWGLPHAIQMKFRHGSCPVAWSGEIVVHLNKLTDIEMRLWVTRIRPAREGLRYAARDEVVQGLLGFEGTFNHAFPVIAGCSLLKALENGC